MKVYMDYYFGAIKPECVNVGKYLHLHGSIARDLGGPAV
jgi:hypothetical protein